MQEEYVFGLIGFPLGHSFSKKYFTEKFEKEGLAGCRFELFPLQNIRELPILLETHPSIRGLAVTIPYKEQVLRYLTQTDSIALEAGAVNCLQINQAEITGYNTDIIGFSQSLQPLLDTGMQRALILGTGGASKAVQHALKKLDIPFLVVSRFEHNVDGYTTYKALDQEIISTHTLIIQCTPLGMTPDEDGFPDIPYEYLTPSHVLYDLVYKPPMTRFLEKGALRGARIKNGFEMLVIQAEENWKIWTQHLQLPKS